MKVRDYYNDMVLSQKWVIEVEYLRLNYSLPYPVVKYSLDTFHYSVPFVGKCPYLDYTVRYFRIANNEIILCISDIEEV